MKNKPRNLTLFGQFYNSGVSVKYLPSLLIKGKWFLDYGFKAGDRVTLTNPKPGSMLITVTKPAAVMEQESAREDREIDMLSLERRLKAA